MGTKTAPASAANESSSLLPGGRAPPTALPRTLEAALALNEQLLAETAQLRVELTSLQAAAGDQDRVMTIHEYLRIPLCRHLRIRLPWLIILLLLQSFSASIMHGFEEILESNFVVALFVTMLVGTGGNAGNQSGVIVTRALSRERDFIYANYGRVLRQEAQLALVQGTVLAAITFGRVLAEFPEHIWPALTIASALFVVVFFSMLLGIVFSLGIDRLRLDPAAGAAPLLTVVADMMGIMTLCLVGLAILGWQHSAPSYCDPEKMAKCPQPLLMQSVAANLTNTTLADFNSAAYAEPIPRVLTFPSNL